MADPTSWTLADGGHVQITPISGGFTSQLYAGDGTAEGDAFAAVQPQLGLYTFENLTPLTTGGYVLDYIYNGALLPGFFIESAAFDAQGHLLGQSQVSLPASEHGAFPMTQGQAYALPDGGFVVAWADSGAYSAAGQSQALVREFDADGQPVEAPQMLGVLTVGSPGVQVNSDGQYVVSWLSPTGLQQQTFAEQSAPAQSDPVQPSPTRSGDGDDAFVANPAVTLAASGGWSGAALLSNGQLTVVSVQDGGYGSHVAATQTYDAAGDETSSASTMGYAGAGAPLTPHIAALGTGGFYEVSYAGSTDYEIHAAAGQRVFAHNAYTNPNAEFTALQGGGYVVTDFPDGAMAVYDSQGHAAGWYSLSGSAPRSIVARSDGGFDFVYSDHVLGYDAQGHQDVDSHLGFPPSGFATAATALGGDAIGEVWLSPFEGQGGQATSIYFERIQSGPELRAIQVAQDLDPWHTTFQLQSHTDGSVAILWSQGGGIFGAEYANGQVGQANAAVAGDLGASKVIQTAGDKVGLAWLQNGDVWAEVFDPSTGAAVRADLGASDGDLSHLNALGTNGGGIAVSWHQGNGAVMASVLEAAGTASAAIALPGDFIGVDGSGHAVTLHDQGGMPVMQTYALTSGLFFVS